MATVLKTQDLQAGYLLLTPYGERAILAVNGVNIEIFHEEIYGIAGESGSGKTTLLKTLFGEVEVPLRVLGGKVYYSFGNEFVDALLLKEEEKRRIRWRYISYIPQGSMSVFNPVKRIHSTFLDFLKSHVEGKVQEELFELVKKHVSALGLPTKVLSAYPHQLSGGMKQRLAIALATILNPKVILADEPTTALDVVAQRAAIQLLKDIQREYRNTIVIVTHDMGIHAHMTHRLAIMYAGRIVEEGPTSVILDQPLHPYTQYLIGSLPTIGDKTFRDSVPGAPPSFLDLPPGCAFHPRCPQVFSVCKTQTPELVNVDERRKAACWLWMERG